MINYYIKNMFIYNVKIRNNVIKIDINLKD